MKSAATALLALVFSSALVGVLFHESLGSIIKSDKTESSSSPWNENGRRKLIDLVPTNPEDKWNPVDCPALLEFVNQGDVWDPNSNHLFGRWTTTNPPFFIAMNEWKYDLMRKVIYDAGEYYEKALTKTFSNILKYSPPNSRVVDVGGNIGWFTMVSAAHGHHVDVFEPNKVNIVRQCQSMWMNRWDNAEEDEILARTDATKRGSINIRPYGVGANTTTMTFFVGKNPGKATMLRSMLSKKVKLRDSSQIHIVTLDSLAEAKGWFEKKVPIAILKVDVEGFEPSVFSGAKKLLKSGLIENILMEVSGQDDNSENIAMMQLIIDSGFHIHQIGGSDGPGGKNLPPKDENLAKMLMEWHAGRGGLQANLWWKFQREEDTLYEVSANGALKEP